MKTKKRLPAVISVILAVIVLSCAAIWLYIALTPWGYAREVSPEEQALREKIVTTAQSWLGSREEDGTHHPIIDRYNTHTPLAQGYEVQYDDNWCSTFVSTVAIQCGMTDIIPTECGCERHTKLFMEMDCWVEDDGYIPLPGDYIFYCWNDKGIGDCTGWSNHVGIVVGTAGPFIKVIEGNYNDRVDYRIILINAPGIRGFGTPDYGSLS